MAPRLLHLVAAGLVINAVSVATTKPNFLFILTDDMGWGDVSYNKEYFMPGAGGKNWTIDAPRTPNIDKLALAEGTMLFRRFYAGSAVCSPTRASILSGRTPQRSCINSAEGCGQSPAWSCYDKMPFPPTEFTVAEAAKQKGYATLFVGKWHLGDFWDKGESSKGNYALGKWPASHPGMHGFDEWAGTEASASSSTTNCGCVASWKDEGQGCIVGGGSWTKKKALECTNYWSPTDLNKKHAPTRPECHITNTTTRDCLANLTTKIEGDDAMHMMDVFEDFVSRKGKGGSEAAPWLAQLSIHTNHEPHPSLPEWYHAYNTTEGTPAGDYHGTISQMDHAIGRLSDILEKYGADKNTMIWYTHDNGAHTAGRASGQNSASNGLRQCKASLFEGGIRVGGWVRWPGVIKGHVDTLHAAATMDFLPTVLEVLGMNHPKPEWFSDGMSLVPLLRGDIPANTPRTKPMGFAQSGQVAWQNDTGADGVWKIIVNPQKGQCGTFLPPYSTKSKGPFLFNLTADSTESDDLCKTLPERCTAMKKAMQDFEDSITHSRVFESECQKGSPSPSPSPGPTPAPVPPSGGFELVTKDDECLTLQGLDKHAAVVLGACDSGSRWDINNNGHLVNLADGSMCLKLDMMDAGGDGCKDQTTIWMGKCTGGEEGDKAKPSDPMFLLDDDGHLAAAGCPEMCAVANTRSNVFVYTSSGIALGSCLDDVALAFRKRTPSEQILL